MDVSKFVLLHLYSIIYFLHVWKYLMEYNYIGKVVCSLYEMYKHFYSSVIVSILKFTEIYSHPVQELPTSPLCIY